MQNMIHEFSKKELDKAYSDYINDKNVINVRNLQKVSKYEKIYYFKKDARRFDNNNSFTAYFYFEDRKQLEKRVCKKIKGSNNYQIKIE
jgi:hypothetical protein